MTPARKALEAEIAKLGLPRNKTVEQERIEELEAELAALRKRLEQARRVDIDLETQYIDAQLKLVELNKELANYRTDTKMLLDLGERHVQIENELTQKLIAQRAELAALRKALDDRRTVGKYEAALRDIVGYREANRDPKNRYPFPDYYDFDAVEAIAKEALKP